MPRLPSARLTSSLVTTAAQQHGLLTTGQLRAAGIDRNALRSLQRSSTLFPVFIGIWSLVPAADLHRVTLVRAARLAVGGGTACLSSAALLQGDLPSPLSHDDRPQLSLPESATRHQLRGIGLHWLALGSAEVTTVAGIPVTTPLRLFLDASKNWSRADAVALLDAALRSGKLTLAEVSGLEGRFAGRAKAWATLADPLSESPLETHTRLLLIDAGVDGLVSQHRVRSPSGRVIARLDLAVPAARIGIECDGNGPHELPEALFRDRRRQDDLHAVGWRLVRVTWEDLRRQPDDVVRRVRRALAQAS